MAVLRPYKPPKRYIPKNRKTEESLQRQVCTYIKLQFPQVIFRSDYASGLHLTIAQATTHKSLQSGRSWPDLFIYMPRKVEGKQYAGLALELKKDNTSIKQKIGKNKGQLVANPHIREQYYMLQELNKLGYWADFAIGFDDAVAKIDHYMGKPKLENETMF
jgi:hypothetical protein